MTNLNKYDGKMRNVHVNMTLYSLYYVHYVNHLNKKCHVYIHPSCYNFNSLV